MKGELIWLYENDTYKVYANCEYVYLKDKAKCQFQDQWEKTDKFMVWIYGNPTGALIMPSNDFVVIVGCGISIYNIERADITDYYNDPEDIWWIQAVFQDCLFDDWRKEFRVVTYNDKDETRVFKFNLDNKSLIEI
mgnify:CR=1 FL=1